MSITTVVSPPETTPETPPVTPPAAPATEDAAALRSELEALRTQVAESNRNAQYWHEQARTRTPEPPARAAEPEPELPEADLLDIITTQGAKGFDKYMRERGFISRREAEQMASSLVNTTVAKVSAERELIDTYPELGDRSSEFFQSTAGHYGELRKQGVPEALAMKLAAEKAELDGFKTGKVKTPTQARTDREAERQARIKAQAPERTTRTQAPVDADEGDDTLTDHERHICQAMGISEEAYIARAKAGVRMSARSAMPKGKR